MTARILPKTVVAERRTPTFTADTVPPGLLAKHKTGAWARLEVEAGTVEFTEDESGWTATATPESPIVIVPGRLHRVLPSSDARFAVQFFTDVTDVTDVTDEAD